MDKPLAKEYLDIVISEAVRFCPKCKKQSYNIKINRTGMVLFGECVLCGYKYESK